MKKIRSTPGAGTRTTGRIVLVMAASLDESGEALGAALGFAHGASSPPGMAADVEALRPET